jgi:hypothetical protein
MPIKTHFPLEKHLIFDPKTTEKPSAREENATESDTRRAAREYVNAQLAVMNQKLTPEQYEALITRVVLTILRQRRRRLLHG